jgi:periplasmic copper chaperone A
VKTSLALVAVAALALVACGGDDAGNDGTGDDGAGSVAVSNAWARTSPMSASVGALYLTIEADTDDQLQAVTVDPSVAARTEIHETATVTPTTDAPADDPAGDTADDMGDMGDNDGGMMTMREIGSLDLPAGERVELRPGGFHVMLLDRAGPLVIGESFDATLEFADAASVTVTVEIRDEAP